MYSTLFLYSLLSCEISSYELAYWAHYIQSPDTFFFGIPEDLCIIRAFILLDIWIPLQMGFKGILRILVKIWDNKACCVLLMWFLQTGNSLSDRCICSETTRSDIQCVLRFSNHISKISFKNSGDFCYLAKSSYKVDTSSSFSPTQTCNSETTVLGVISIVFWYIVIKTFFFFEACGWWDFSTFSLVIKHLHLSTSMWWN